VILEKRRFGLQDGRQKIPMHEMLDWTAKSPRFVAKAADWPVAILFCQLFRLSHRKP
jgi:hypothetical protein